MAGVNNGDGCLFAIFVDGTQVGAEYQSSHAKVYGDDTADEKQARQAVIDYTFTSRGSNIGGNPGQFPADTNSHTLTVRWRATGGTSTWEAVRWYRSLTVTEIDV